MRQMRHVVLGLHDACRFLQSALRVPDLTRNAPWLCHGGRELAPVALRIVGGVRSVIPHHVEHRLPAHGSPSVIRDDGDAAPWLKLERRLRVGHLEHVPDARDRKRALGVEADVPAAHDWRPYNHRREHARYPDVRAEHGLARYVRRRVEQRQCLADIE
jgi:hypothetical protein